MLSIRYQVSGILIYSGEALARGYYNWHPEKKKKGKKGTKAKHKRNTEEVQSAIVNEIR